MESNQEDDYDSEIERQIILNEEKGLQKDDTVTSEKAELISINDANICF
jgi:hypothetical protein